MVAKSSVAYGVIAAVKRTPEFFSNLPHSFRQEILFAFKAPSLVNILLHVVFVNP